MYLQQEQLREENTHHVCELSKRIKEQERDLEQRQGEYEVHVKQTTRENLELKQEQEKHQEGTRETQQSFAGIVHSKTKVCRHCWLTYSPLWNPHTHLVYYLCKDSP